MERKCIVCGKKLPAKELMELKKMPASAQDIPDASQVKEDAAVDLKLYSCPGCGLIQFSCEPVSYYRDVIRSGGFSTTMVELRRAQYRYLIDTYGLEGKKFLEVGCGQGEFLSVLKEFPVEVYGIEHKEELVKLARERGLQVERDFLGEGGHMLKDGPFDVFLSFNFLEHQPDPNGMLEGIYDNLAEDGMGLITVPSFEYIMEHDGYYELIRDHLAYYTFDSLRILLEKNGFIVLKEELINRDTLSVIVKKRKQPDVSKIAESYKEIPQQIQEFVEQAIRKEKKVAIWGASHQGFTLASTADLGKKVSYIIDSAPFKQGRYAPASHIPIVSPGEAQENPADIIIIMAPGYTKEIAGVIREKFAPDTQIWVMMTNHLQEYKDIEK